MYIKKSAYIALAVWVFVVLSLTIFIREPQAVANINNQPLRGYYQYCYNYLRADYLNNLFLFVPLGCIIGWLYEKNRLTKSLLCGFCFSLFIESLQYVTRRGTFDVDDLIHNTIGASIGSGILIIVMRTKNRQKLQNGKL